MNALDRLDSGMPVTRLRLVAGLICALIAAFLVWANFAELEEVAIAECEVMPQGQIKVIQHLVGGIIEQILVS